VRNSREDIANDDVAGRLLLSAGKIRRGLLQSSVGRQALLNKIKEYRVGSVVAIRDQTEFYQLLRHPRLYLTDGSVLNVGDNDPYSRCLVGRIFEKIW
jgi:hypothetical protein